MPPTFIKRKNIVSDMFLFLLCSVHHLESSLVLISPITLKISLSFVIFLQKKLSTRPN